MHPPDRRCCRPHTGTSPRCIFPNSPAKPRANPGASSLLQAGLGTEWSLTDNGQNPRQLRDGGFGLPLTKARQPRGAPGVPCAAHASPNSLVLPARPALPPALLVTAALRGSALAFHTFPGILGAVGVMPCQQPGTETAGSGYGRLSSSKSSRPCVGMGHHCGHRTPTPWAVKQGVARLLGLEQHFG